MYMFAVRESDVLYDPLPLYHSAGGMLGVGIMLTHGSTVVVRRRFTASGYWRDVSEHGCTVRPAPDTPPAATNTVGTPSQEWGSLTFLAFIAD